MKQYRSFLVILALLVFLPSCTTKGGAVFTKLDSEIEKEEYGQFSKYCQDDGSNPEESAVLASFIGEHQKSAFYAYQRSKMQPPYHFDYSNKEELIDHFNQVLEDSASTNEEISEANSFLEVLNRPKSLDELFSDYQLNDAVSYITKSASEYHFTLINEAHYSSQNRTFTTSLLAPLQELGYKYLALEALGYYDSKLNERSYPIIQSGYYIRESSFGNMLREALRLGFTLIPYETRRRGSGTNRDYDQATNIMTQTWEKDTVGKVLVHVGYGHLLETGGASYIPMGAQLKKMYEGDILTVEQQQMRASIEESQNHEYYNHVNNNYNLDEPSVFVKNGKCLVDPVRTGSIDIQVYHPHMKLIKDRPTWLLLEGYSSYPLPEGVTDIFNGFRIKARKKGEPNNAVAIDQFVINDKKELILKSGSYNLQIIDCADNIIARYEMKAQ